MHVPGTLRDTLISLSVLIAGVVSLNEFLLVDIVHKDPSSIADTVVSYDVNIINKIPVGIFGGGGLMPNT